MKIHQLSLFLENKPGSLVDPIRLVSEAGVDLRTLTLADTERFGILRMIVSDWEKAKSLLQSAGFVVNVVEVVAVEVPDRPGGLAELLTAFEGTDVNIEYMYAFPFGRGSRAVLIFRFDRPDAAIVRLQARGLNVVGSVEVYNRIRE
jgi:hypothetical protein